MTVVSVFCYCLYLSINWTCLQSLRILSVNLEEFLEQYLQYHSFLYLTLTSFFMFTQNSQSIYNNN